jgi:hypothetical protein
LLGVLLAEIRDVGLNDLEKLEDDGGHALEMAGPILPAQVIREPSDVDGHFHRPRIHFAHGRGKHEVNAMPAA